MRKKIIIVVGIVVVLLIGGFTTSKLVSVNNELNVPQVLELKDEYSSDINQYFPNNLKQCALQSISMYQNINTEQTSDEYKLDGMKHDLINFTDGTDRTANETTLIGKVNIIDSDFVEYNTSEKQETRIKIKKDIQDLLSCYN